MVGVEPAAADDAWRSFRSGQRESLSGVPATLADGLRGSIGRRNFELLRREVDDVLVVDEAAIVSAMRQVLQHFRILIEPSSAVPIAALLEGRMGRAGEQVGIVVSGGNVDLQACAFLRGPAGGDIP